jgi:hypothetical protein
MVILFVEHRNKGIAIKALGGLDGSSVLILKGVFFL